MAKKHKLRYAQNQWEKFKKLLEQKMPKEFYDISYRDSSVLYFKNNVLVVNVQSEKIISYEDIFFDIVKPAFRSCFSPNVLLEYRVTYENH